LSETTVSSRSGRTETTRIVTTSLASAGEGEMIAVFAEEAAAV
jgi:hypothetical protein